MKQTNKPAPCREGVKLVFALAHFRKEVKKLEPLVIPPAVREAAKKAGIRLD